MINLFDVKVDKNGVAQFVLDRGFKELNVVPQAFKILKEHEEKLIQISNELMTVLKYGASQYQEPNYDEDDFEDDDWDEEEGE